MAMKSSFSRVAVVLSGFALIGCSVKLVSPYIEDVSKRAAGLYEDVIAFELSMRRQVGTWEGDPRNRANQARFDKWQASIATMATLSATADPRIVRCQEIMLHLNAPAAGIDQATVQALQDQTASSGPATDCQTLGITRLSQRVEQLRQLYASACRVPALPDSAFLGTGPHASQAPARLPDCEALWTPPAAAAGLGLTGSHGLGVDPVLRSIRAVIAVQEGKRSITN